MPTAETINLAPSWEDTAHMCCRMLEAGHEKPELVRDIMGAMGRGVDYIAGKLDENGELHLPVKDVGEFIATVRGDPVDV